jgi:catechol 2,3-dioxygenase-like lactoylglutathione lyase family enzyme
MNLRLGSTVINCSDLETMTDFWSAALGLTPSSRLPDDDFRVLRGARVNMSLQLADTPVTARDQMHLDLYTDDQDGEVHRLEELGARFVRDSEPGDDYVVMLDPEGNEFCVCAVSPRPAAYIAVVGPSERSLAALPESAQLLQAAFDAGELLARQGAVVTCVGILAGSDRSEAHGRLAVAIPTGLGELRNGLIVRSADGVLSIGGSWGTLSEIALAIRTDIPVVSLSGWALPAPGIIHHAQVPDAVDALLARCS